jgi:RNA methyltransferase, TrmH family
MNNGPTITSTRNRRIVEARKLAQRKHRQAQGAFLVEGLQLLHMALDAGARPCEVFYCRELFVGDVAPALLERFGQMGAELVPVAAPVLRALSDRDTPQGLVARFPLVETPIEALALSRRDLVLVLDRLRDPGNIGTLIRTADAVGAAAVVLIEPCADPFDPKTVRSSMGSLFNLPLVRTADVDGLFRKLNQVGLPAVGADLDGLVAWEADVWRQGLALVLGTEGEGLSPDVRAGLTQRVGLPMVGRAESLNVAVAGGILMYLWLQHHPGDRA